MEPRKMGTGKYDNVNSLNKTGKFTDTFWLDLVDTAWTRPVCLDQLVAETIAFTNCEHRYIIFVLFVTIHKTVQ